MQKEYNISGENILYCEGKSGIMDFAIMKACDHNITCYNMSFGGRLRIPLKTLLIDLAVLDAGDEVLRQEAEVGDLVGVAHS